jgi:MATE family multidrug resistance protein
VSEGATFSQTAPRRVEASARAVLALAVPVTLANIATPLLGLVDSTVVGRLGEAHLLAAVATAATVVNFLFWLMGFLRMGTAGLVAQAKGAGDERARRLALARALCLALGLGLAMIALSRPLGDLGFWLMGASERVTTAARAYFDVRVWSAPFALINYVVLGALLGAGRATLGLAMQAGLNLINAALAIVFVMVFQWGLAGAAWATLVAEALTAGAGVFGFRLLGWGFTAPREDLFERAGFVRMLAMNRDIMIRTAALLMAFSTFTAMGARLGDVTLAANAVLMTLFTLLAYGLDGFATAAEQMAGQSIGARDEAGFRASVRLAGLFCVGLGGLGALAAYAGGGALIDFMTTNEATRVAAKDNLIYAALTPLLGAPAFLYDGVFIGATWTRAMRSLMLAALAIFLVALLALKSFGATGLWIALLIFLAARGVLQAWRFPVLTRRAFAR